MNREPFVDERTRLQPSLRVVGLFAGIAGIEHGLHLAGHRTVLLGEIDPGARAVLSTHFPGVPSIADVRLLSRLPDAEVVTAGFPCQDLSQAGRTAGIKGSQSGLVGEVFRLIEAHALTWLLLENVPFMLQLDRGEAMRFLTRTLEEAGFSWAYRTVDARGFGLPQRRQRVLLLASRTQDPRRVLLVDDHGRPPSFAQEDSPCGFYWTEGTRGLGWAVDAVPTLKGGSTIGIPSPPGIWMRHEDGAIVQPEIRDAERLQGFDADWTLPALEGGQVRQGARWKLVGNAVCVPVAEWIGRCLRTPRSYDEEGDEPLERSRGWPRAAWGVAGRAHAADVSMWPLEVEYQHLAGFLRHPPVPLSRRASAGFLARAQKSGLRFAEGFLDAVAVHLESRQGEQRGEREP